MPENHRNVQKMHFLKKAEGVVFCSYTGFYSGLDLFVLIIWCLMLFTQKAKKYFPLNIHRPEHCSLLTEGCGLVSQPTVMELFPISFNFNSIMFFCGNVCAIPLHAEHVDFWEGKIREPLGDLCNLAMIRRSFWVALRFCREGVLMTRQVAVVVLILSITLLTKPLFVLLSQTSSWPVKTNYVNMIKSTGKLLYLTWKSCYDSQYLLKKVNFY